MELVLLSSAVQPKLSCLESFVNNKMAAWKFNQVHLRFPHVFCFVLRFCGAGIKHRCHTCLVNILPLNHTQPCVIILICSSELPQIIFPCFQISNPGRCIQKLDCDYGQVIIGLFHNYSYGDFFQRIRKTSSFSSDHSELGLLNLGREKSNKSSGLTVQMSIHLSRTLLIF